MDHESSVVDFLAQKENILFALEIAERIEEVKDKLHRDFWFTINNILSDKLDKHEANTRWRVSYYNGLDKNITIDHGGISIEPTNKDILYLFGNMGQEYYKGCPRIYYGIWWNESLGREIVLPEVNKLMDNLKNEEYVGVGDGESVGWKWTDCYARTKEFLLNVADNKEYLAGNMANILWNMFEEKIAMMDSINYAITQAIKMGNNYP